MGANDLSPKDEMALFGAGDAFLFLMKSPKPVAGIAPLAEIQLTG